MSPPRFPGIDGDIQAWRERLEEWQRSPEGQKALQEERERERQEEQRKRENEEQRRRQRLVDCGVPRRVRDLLDAGPRDTQVMHRVKQWRAQREKDQSRWCLVLSATKGAGKTVAAGWWMANSDPHCASWWDGKAGEWKRIPSWWTAPQLCRINTYGSEFDALCSLDAPLVVDDLGAEYSDKAGFMQVMIDALIDTRYSEYLPTLITTNLNAKSFRDRYGERVADRMREGGAFFEFQEKSMRVQR